MLPKLLEIVSLELDGSWLILTNSVRESLEATAIVFSPEGSTERDASGDMMTWQEKMNMGW